MLAKLSDTSREAERVLIESYRRLSMLDKWRQMGSIYRTARTLHAAGFRLRNPAATEVEIAESWMRQNLSASVIRQIKEARHGFRSG